MLRAYLSPVVVRVGDDGVIERIPQAAIDGGRAAWRAFHSIDASRVDLCFLTVDTDDHSAILNDADIFAFPDGAPDRALTRRELADIAATFARHGIDMKTLAQGATILESFVVCADHFRPGITSADLRLPGA
ncbi:MAG: hypothetical protein ACTHKB_00685 [Burkholderiaceae bacterium]